MNINLTKVKQFAARLRLESRYGVYEARPHYEECAYILMGRKPKRGRYRGFMAVCPLWIRIGMVR